MRHNKIPLRTFHVVFCIEELYREHVEPLLIDIQAEFPYMVNQSTVDQIFQELVRQAVDTYHYSLEIYEPQVRMPNVHLLLAGEMIHQNTELYKALCTAYHEFSIGLYLQLHTNAIVRPWIDIIFHHLDNTKLVLRIVEYPQMDYVQEL